MKLLIVGLLFLAFAAAADTQSRADAFAAKAAGDYQSAAQIFAYLLQQQPNDAELWFHYGLVLRFAGRLDEAMEAQRSAHKLAPQDLDIQLEIARLHFYRGDVPAAREQLHAIQGRAGDYPGVADLQRQLEIAATSTTTSRPWWLTLGHEWSRLERGDRWQMNLLHLNRTLSPDLSVQVHLEHAERYDNSDYYAALSGFYRLSAKANIAGGLGSGIDADYLPRKRMWLYGDRQIWQTREFATTVRATLDVSHSRYQDLHVSVAKPGVRVEFAETWEWSLQSILVDSSGAQAQNGWATRVAWNWRTPALRLDAGYSNAPESDESITVDTRGYFVGARWQFSQAAAFALSLAREERERTPFRDLANISFILRF